MSGMERLIMETPEPYNTPQTAVTYSDLRPEQWKWLLENANDIVYEFDGETIIIEKSVYNLIETL
jgi:hypothetical protein